MEFANFSRVRLTAFFPQAPCWDFLPEIGCSSSCSSQASLRDVLEIVATASASDAGASLPKMSSSVTFPVTLEHVFCIFLTPRAGPEKMAPLNGDQLDY